MLSGNLITDYTKWCQKKNPPPIYCEIPDDLKFTMNEVMGTVQTYIYTPSTISGSTTPTTIL